MSVKLISPHGGYKDLKTFQMSEIVFDFTFEFVKLYIDVKSRTKDQMEQAARSGKQNISEGSQTSGTSKQSELRLVDVARASLEELLNDYKDFLRTNKLSLWSKDDVRAVEIRRLAYKPDRSYTTYKTYLSNSESAANCALCLINQTNYLLDQQLRSLEKDFINRGDLKDRYKEIRKQEVIGSNDNYDEFIKQFGLRRLENGMVVKIDKDNK
jgi:restriction system protein